MKDNKNKKTFKELWANTQSRALIKLGMWFAFFILFFLVMSLVSVISPKKETKTNTQSIKKEEKVEVNVNKMVENLIDATYSYEYKVTNNENSYSYTGTKTKDSDSGYFEKNNNIIKYTVVDDNYYEVVNEQINPDNILMNDYDKNNINLNNILDKLKQTEDVEKEDDTYIYNFTDGSSILKIKISVNSVNVEKIEIEYNDSNYALTYKNVD